MWRQQFFIRGWALSGMLDMPDMRFNHRQLHRLLAWLRAKPHHLLDLSPYLLLERSRRMPAMLGMLIMQWIDGRVFLMSAWVLAARD